MNSEKVLCTGKLYVSENYENRSLFPSTQRAVGFQAECPAPAHEPALVSTSTKATRSNLNAKAK
jgi:hypothetical protein